MAIMNFIDLKNFVIYIVLFGATTFINKYVLSVLGFTYPTIYQGWQTLIGAILLRLLLYRSTWLEISPTPLDKAGFISLLPSFLFFVAGIVASSKALASLSIGMFLCLHNTLCSVLFLLEIFPSIRTPYGGAAVSPSSYNTKASPVGKLEVLAALVVIGTALAAVVGDLSITFADSPYFWLMVSLGCVAVQRLHSKIADARYTEVDRLYCSYVFSVVVLAPASLYLEEAFDVLQFQHASRLDFMGACLLVGVVSLLLSVHLFKVQQHPHFSKLDAMSKLLCSLCSLFVFDDDTSSTVKTLVLINMTAGAVVPAPTITAPPDADWPSSSPPSHSQQKLLPQHRDDEISDTES